MSHHHHHRGPNLGRIVTDVLLTENIIATNNLRRAEQQRARQPNVVYVESGPRPPPPPNVVYVESAPRPPPPAPKVVVVTPSAPPPPPPVYVGEDRYFRTPILEVPGAFWYVHYKGEFSYREVSVYPNRPAVLAMRGYDDERMSRATLNETKLIWKPEATITAHEFERVWEEHGGRPMLAR